MCECVAPDLSSNMKARRGFHPLWSRTIRNRSCDDGVT